MPAPLENPPVWIGRLDGRDDVAIVVNPGTDQQQTLCFSPMVALAIAAEIGKYGQALLAKASAAVARHDANTRPPMLREVRRFDS